MRRLGFIVAGGVAAALALSCCNGSENDARPAQNIASLESLLDPKFCEGCHREQYAEWAGSMHAYAAVDPVFRALNARMQREVEGPNKTFCLTCHAPMAVRLGKTIDGANLDENPALGGVTCFFCHTVSDVQGTHNNPLVLGNHEVMAGPIHDPIDPRVHKTEYRPVLDGTQENQSGMCGACHDIVTVGNAHIERTFREWSRSRFGVGERFKTSCPSCHMPARDAPIAVVPGAPVRKAHDHSMVGVDLALTPFPDKAKQRELVQKSLDEAIDARLCVRPTEAGGAVVRVDLANRRVGHAWPSGSTQDRRAWVELVASSGGAVLLESGRIPDNAAVASIADTNLFLLRDYDFDAQDHETHLFWRAVRYTSNQLPALVTSNTADPRYENWVGRDYPLPTMPDRVVMNVKIRPIDFDLLDELQKEGVLDPTSLEPIPTFTLSKAYREWTKSSTACLEAPP